MGFKFITAITVAALVAVLAPATTAAAVPVCTEDVRFAQPITGPETGQTEHVGEIQLRQDDCGNYWTHLTFYYVLGSDEYAEARITRWDSGAQTAIASSDIPSRGSSATMTEYATPTMASANSMSLFISSVHYYHRSGPSSGWQHGYSVETPAMSVSA